MQTAGARHDYLVSHNTVCYSGCSASRPGPNGVGDAEENGVTPMGWPNSLLSEQRTACSLSVSLTGWERPVQCLTLNHTPMLAHGRDDIKASWQNIRNRDFCNNSKRLIIIITIITMLDYYY